MKKMLHFPVYRGFIDGKINIVRKNQIGENRKTGQEFRNTEGATYENDAERALPA